MSYFSIFTSLHPIVGTISLNIKITVFWNLTAYGLLHKYCVTFQKTKLNIHRRVNLKHQFKYYPLVSFYASQVLLLMECSNTMLNECLVFPVHTACLTIFYSHVTKLHIHADKLNRTPSSKVTNRVPWFFFVCPTTKRALKQIRF
jgi:hypothetical protein